MCRKICLKCCNASAYFHYSQYAPTDHLAVKRKNSLRPKRSTHSVDSGTGVGKTANIEDITPDHTGKQHSEKAGKRKEHINLTKVCKMNQTTLLSTSKNQAKGLGTHQVV